jgi:hypothetical protein
VEEIIGAGDAWENMDKMEGLFIRSSSLSPDNKTLTLLSEQSNVRMTSAIL